MFVPGNFNQSSQLVDTKIYPSNPYGGICLAAPLVLIHTGRRAPPADGLNVQISPVYDEHVH